MSFVEFIQHRRFSHRCGKWQFMSGLSDTSRREGMELPPWKTSVMQDRSSRGRRGKIASFCFLTLPTPLVRDNGRGFSLPASLGLTASV